MGGSTLRLGRQKSTTTINFILPNLTHQLDQVLYAYNMLMLHVLQSLILSLNIKQQDT